jgi:hypothetical protein
MNLVDIRQNSVLMPIDQTLVVLTKSECIQASGRGM